MKYILLICIIIFFILLVYTNINRKEKNVKVKNYDYIISEDNEKKINQLVLSKNDLKNELNRLEKKYHSLEKEDEITKKLSQEILLQELFELKKKIKETNIN